MRTETNHFFLIITLTLFLGFSAEVYADFKPNLIRQHVRSMAYRLGIESKKIDDLLFNLDKGMAKSLVPRPDAQPPDQRGASFLRPGKAV